MSCSEEESSSQSTTQPKRTQPFSQDTQETQRQPSAQCHLKAWAFLAGLSYNLPKMFTLDQDIEYKFGRSKSANLTFKLQEHAIPIEVFGQLSKNQFNIFKWEGGIVLEDKSSNGTFVNGRRVGGSKVEDGVTPKVVLQHGDQINLADKDGPGFSVIFPGMGNEYENEMPLEVTDRFRLIGVLGSGGSATVYLATELNTCKKYALKKIDKNFLTAGMNSVTFINNEIKILKSINHERIVNVADVLDLQQQTFIVMEYMGGGSLATRMKERKYEPFKECYCLFITFQLLSALEYLNTQSIIHRDVKPENILMCSKDNKNDYRVKLADFGLSKLVSQSRKAVTCCGSYEYVAPEVIKSDGKAYTSKVDIWSLGVTMFFCLSGKMPFMSNDTSDLKQLILSGLLPSMKGDPRWDKISQEAQQLVRMMLKVNPDIRLSATELLKMDWFKRPSFQQVARLKRLPPPFDRNELTPAIKRIHLDCSIAK